MHVEEAIRQISDIRRQMAQTQIFRGYRSATVAASGGLGLVAAAVQPYWAAEPMRELDRYLALWGGVAGACLILAGIEMYARCRRAGSGIARAQALAAVAHFAPCLVVGALLTLCIRLTSPEVAWMLPGLWALLYGLGVMASQRLLPAATFWVGAHYILAGVICLALGKGESALSPWMMAVSFGAGQLLSAVALYRTLERSDGTA
jgi:hypothetical protein